MSLFSKKKKQQPANDAPAGFLSFILLDKATIDLNLLKKHAQEDWGMEVFADNTATSEDSMVTEIDGMMVAVALMSMPIPNGEAVENAKTNFRWPEAVAVAENHKAHIMVSVMARGQAPAEAALLQVKICASCLRQPHSTAINTLGTVFEPGFYTDMAKHFIENDVFPIMNTVFFGIYSNDDGQTYCGYTYGLQDFGKQNIEILQSAQSADEVFGFMVDIASYIINYNAVLQDGQTIGFTAEQKLPITESAGAAVEGNTFKIQF